MKISAKHCPKKMQIVLLSAVVLFGAVLRFWDLGQWSFWRDEVFTVLDAQRFSLDTSPINPIPYLAVKLSIVLAGTSEWGSRFIPCLAGILSIPIIFGLGRTLFNWRVGLLAGAFVAFSSWHLFWTQNARSSYILTFLFAALTAWFFYLSLKRDSTLLTVAALFSCLCLILSHLLSAVIVPALGVYAVLCLLEKSNRKRWLNLILFFLPFALPLFMLAHPHIRGYLFSGWGRNEWQRSPLYIVLTLVQGVSIPVAVTALFAAVSKPFDRSTRFLVCYAGVPLCLFLVASQFQNVAGYYLFWTTPAYFILAAVACDSVWKTFVKASTPQSGAICHPDNHNLCRGSALCLPFLLPSLLIMVLLAQDYLYFNLENGGRPKWREAFEVIRSEMQSTDKVVLSQPEMGVYYLPELAVVDIDGLLRDAAGFEAQWQVSDKGRLWFLVDVANFNVFDANQNVRKWIRERGHLLETLPVFSRARDRTIHIYLLE